MKNVSIIGIIVTVGVLVLLKVFQDSFPRIDEPVTNIVVFVVVFIIGALIVTSHIKNEKEK